MKKWNCKRMIRMMPLYVAGDLAAARESKAAGHLAACERCRGLSEEFSESGALLINAWALPEFDAEFYAGIRTSVLREITQQRSSSKPSLFAGRWVYATALAVAIIVFAVVLQLHRTAPKSPRDLAFNPVVPVVIEPAAPKLMKVAVPSSSPQLAELPQSQRKSRRQIVVRNTSAPDLDRTTRDSALKITPAMQLSPTVGTVASARLNREPVTLPGGSAALKSGPASTSGVSRIEIRTADPNIRIIWLGARKSPGSGDTYHNQNEDENRDRN